MGDLDIHAASVSLACSLKGSLRWPVLVPDRSLRAAVGFISRGWLCVAPGSYSRSKAGALEAALLGGPGFHELRCLIRAAQS